MAVPRFQSRLALLDLELRRLLRQPWLPLASLMLAPLPLVLLVAPLVRQTAPGLDLYRVASAGWVVVGLMALTPLLGLVFRGEAKQHELEHLALTGYSASALAAGLVGSRLVMALGILLLPAPILLLCYPLGGVMAGGLVSACLHLMAWFLTFAAWQTLLGVVLRGGLVHGVCAFVSLLAPIVLDMQDLTAGPLTAAGQLVGGKPAGVSTASLLLGAFLLFGVAWLALRQRILQGFAGAGSLLPGARRRADLPDRPEAGPLAIPWKERHFALGGSAGRRLAVWWSAFTYPLALAVTGGMLFLRVPSAEDWFWATLLVLAIGTILPLLQAFGLLVDLFAREVRAETFDDLILARGTPFSASIEKIAAWRRRAGESATVFLLVTLGWLGILVMYLATVAGVLRDLDDLKPLFFLGAWPVVLGMLQTYYGAKMLNDWSRTGHLRLTTLARRFIAFGLEWLANLFLAAILLSICCALAPGGLVGMVLMLVLYHMHYREHTLRQLRETSLAFCGRQGEFRDQALWPACVGRFGDLVKRPDVSAGGTGHLEWPE